MKHTISTNILALVTVFLMSITCINAVAGQFKTLDTVELIENEQISARSSPKSTPSGAMELEIYEWETPTNKSDLLFVGAYQCRITQNATGQPLNISLVGPNATIINSCHAPNGGSCSTTPVSLIGGAKFLCIVSNECCHPDQFPSTAHYKMAVRLLESFALKANNAPSPSGVASGHE